MSVGHEDIPRRVSCFLGSCDQEARFCWRDVSLTLDEIHDIEAAETRFLIVYEEILIHLACNIRLTELATSKVFHKG
jgi:hypothetical protein